MMMREPACNGGLDSPALPFELSPQAFHARASRVPERCASTPTSDGFGRPRMRPFVTYDQTSRSWRTYRIFLSGDSETYSQTWPRAGMTRNGNAYQLAPSAPHTDATGSLSLPTPLASDGDKGGRGDLRALVRLGRGSRRRDWPTPLARDWKNRGWVRIRVGRTMLPEAVGGPVSPSFVEWLMGFPIGWTESGA